MKLKTKAKPEQTIFHIDVNSAYLSWSAIRMLFDPDAVDLREIPAIVGGDQQTRHGIVLAKSIPAKAYGIITGEPVAAALRKCPMLTVVAPDHDYYRKMSRQLMEYLADFSPDIEQVSVDECYMDVTSVLGQYQSVQEAALRIKDGVYAAFGFTVNVGISDKKVLAKMASDFEKPNRIHTLYSWEIAQKLWPLPLSELYMCGKSTVSRMQTFGIDTIGDLARTDPQIIALNFKSHGKLLWEYANGIDDACVQTQPSKAKGIGNSATLPKDVVTSEEAYRVLRRLAAKVSSRLRAAHFLAGVVCTEIKYATFQAVSHQQAFQTPTADEEAIFQLACQLFDELWNQDAIRLLGIRTTKLADEAQPVQLTIFDFARDCEERKKKQQLEKAVEAIRKKYGQDAVKRGIEK